MEGESKYKSPAGWEERKSRGEKGIRSGKSPFTLSGRTSISEWRPLTRSMVRSDARFGSIKARSFPSVGFTIHRREVNASVNIGARLTVRSRLAQFIRILEALAPKTLKP